MSGDAAERSAVGRVLDNLGSCPLPDLVDTFLSASAPSESATPAVRQALEVRLYQLLQHLPAQFAAYMAREDDESRRSPEEGDSTLDKSAAAKQRNPRLEVVKMAVASMEEAVQRARGEVDRVETESKEAESRIFEILIEMEGLKDSCAAVNNLTDHTGAVLREVGFDQDP